MRYIGILVLCLVFLCVAVSLMGVIWAPYMANVGPMDPVYQELMVIGGF